jgi:hypothetical protein
MDIVYLLVSLSLLTAGLHATVFPGITFWSFVYVAPSSKIASVGSGDSPYCISLFELCSSVAGDSLCTPTGAETGVALLYFHSKPCS